MRSSHRFSDLLWVVGVPRERGVYDNLSGVMVKSFRKIGNPRGMDFVALRERRDFRVNLRHLLW